MKPSFATSSAIMAYSIPGSALTVSGDMTSALLPVVGEHGDVRFAKFVPPIDVNSTTLQVQKDATSIDTSGDFPTTQLQADVNFRSFLEQVQTSTSVALNAGRENDVWELSSILMDPLNVACASELQVIPQDQVATFADRVRRAALANFWTRLTNDSVQAGLRRAKTGEERALLLLSNGDIDSACRQLIDVKDFKLATMISQLTSSSSDDRSRAVLKKQIDVWRERNDWAEMSDPVRALYSLLAGEVCTVSGKHGSSENRVAEFSIAEKFQLSWMQSFGLRLVCQGHDDCASVISAYLNDLTNGKEHTRPTRTLADGTQVTDTLVEILRLSVGPPDLSALLDSRAVSGSPMNSRLAWQMASLLAFKNIIPIPDDILNQLTLGFGTELEIASKPVTAAWVLLHLPSPSERENSIRHLLNRNGQLISTPGILSSEGDVPADADAHGRGTFEYLTDDLAIPSQLVYHAKALWAQAGLQDPLQQTTFLLRAGEAEDAHDVLLRKVGPTAVIERDYEVLQATLELFESASSEDEKPAGWELGGGGRVYSDFFRVVKKGRGWQKVLPRLRKGLEDFATRASGSGSVGLEERVARSEMLRVVEECERELSTGEDEDSREVTMSGVESRDRLGAAAGSGSDLLERFNAAVGAVV